MLNLFAIGRLINDCKRIALIRRIDAFAAVCIQDENILLLSSGKEQADCKHQEPNIRSFFEARQRKPD
jgi:hypothetical protein